MTSNEMNIFGLKVTESASCSSEEEGVDWSRLVPVIGVFWDIENCQVPRGRSAAAVAQAIRSKLFSGHREVEFVVVCDVTKERPRVVEELNCAKVNLIHVSATCKNAADDKLRQRIRHFGETYDAGSALVLISGDINFSAELIEIRHRRMMDVILVHNSNTSEALKICANQCISFTDLIEHLPERCDFKDDGRSSVTLWVTNVPEDEPTSRVRARLKYLCNNCGGRVEYVSKHLYFIKLANLELGVRAQRRMDGQDVFGRKIVVSDPKSMEWSRTPGRNRPKRPQEHLGKPWDLLVSNNTHQPILNNKVSGIESLRHLNNTLPVVHNDFHKPNNQLPPRMNNLPLKNGVGGIGYRTDSSSCAYDDDESDDEGVPRFSDNLESTGPVDLRVTGLDPLQDPMVTRDSLAEALNMYTKVLNLSVFTQSDESVVATVKVKSLKDAQLVIANLQRHRLGSHRIKISFHNTTPEQRHLTRCQVAELLQEMPPTKVPLFRFKELFKNKYLTSVSVSELRRMRDLCVVTEEENGRMIARNPWAKTSQHLKLPKEYLESPYCDQHDTGRLEYLTEPANLPCVKAGLSLLKDRLHSLLTAHNDRLPIASLHRCYQAYYGSLTVSESEGVSLEHLASCVGDVQIKSQGSIKYLAWEPPADKPVERPLQNSASGVTSQLIELLTLSPRATLSFTDFIPAYHRRFGKQFRLSDFGHTKLLDLLESLPHVVHVIGFGSKKMVTLSHRAQMKRFKADLIKVLKAQPTGSLDLQSFPLAYANHYFRNWEPWQYGVCEIQDLLSSLTSPEVVVSTTSSGQTKISVIVRQQTPEELHLTNKFRSEVVELLKHDRDCSIPLNQFVPSYHTYFGKQCRVASYGFHKLIDLFEAISDTVTVDEFAGCSKKYLTLTVRERLKVLGERFKSVVTSHGGSIMLSELEAKYEATNYGTVEPALYECGTLHQLLDLLSDYVKVIPSPHGYVVIAMQTIDSTALVLRARLIMFRSGAETMSVDQFKIVYESMFEGQEINVPLAASRVPAALQLVEHDGAHCVQLTPSSVFANKMFTLLSECGDRIPLVNFEGMFKRRFGEDLDVSLLGFPNVSALLNGFPETFVVENAGQCSPKYLVLNTNLYKIGFMKPSGWNSYTLWGDTTLPQLRFVMPPDPCTLPIPDSRLTQKRQSRIAAQFEHQ